MGYLTLSKKNIKFLRGKSFKNISAGILVKLSVLLSQLLLVPFFLKNSGTELYGEWLLLSTIPSYLILSDFGLTVTITNEICKLNTLSLYDKANELFKSTMALLLLISGVLELIFIASTFFIDYSAAFHFKVLDRSDANFILGFFILNIAGTLLLNFNLGQFRANDKFYKYELYTSLSYFSDFVLTILVLILNLNFAFIPIFLTCSRIIIFFISKKELSTYEHYEFGVSKDLTPAKRIIPTSISYTMFTLGYALFLQGSTFIVGLKLGSTAVVVFNTVRTLVNSLKAFVSVIYLPALPEYTIMLTKGENENAKRKLAKISGIVLICTLAGCLTIYLAQSLIFQFWLHKKLAYSNIFIILMLASIVFQSLWNASNIVTISVNKNKQLALFPVLAMANLIIQYFIISYFKLEGVALSLLVIDIILFIYVGHLASKIFRTYSLKEK